ncbi:MAG: hypothetical protein PHY47_08565 [Lachnospiraceae bacterium]|nr:hypothetical protein [Lachnospiraceae bacterium]
MEKYREPEGYLFDERTGLYYSQVIGVDETGRQAQIVTWFNAQTGEYSQYTYPVEDGDGKTTEQQNPDNQVWEETVLLEAPPEPEIHDTRTDASSKKTLLPIICGLLVIFIAVVVIKGVLHKRDLQKSAGEELTTEEISTDAISTEALQDIQENDMGDSVKSEEDVRNEITTNEAAADEAATNTDDMDDSIYPFPDYAACNVMTQLADEDDQYVYAIRVTNGAWMFESGIPCGDIVRFPKTGGEAEKIMEAMDGIYSIALMGDDIYYSINYGGEYTYCRKNKKSGEEEVLFQEDYSLMQAYEGKIYLFFAENGRQDIGIFDPATSKMSIQPTDYALTMATGIGAQQSVKAFSPFSVSDGSLYYGGWGDYTICYGKYNFESGQTQILSTAGAYELVDAGYGDYVFTYIDRFGYSPFFINDNCKIDIWNHNLTVALLKNRLLVSECDYDYQFYMVNDNGSMNEILDIKENLPVWAENVYMCGVSENWLIYNDRAVELSLSGEGNVVSFEKTY